MRQQRPQRPIDPNVSRRVKLQQYELQSEIERRNADYNLRQVRDREIGQRQQEEREREQNRTQMMRQAQMMKHPDNNNQFETLDSARDSDFGAGLLSKPSRNPYEVHSYGSGPKKEQQQNSSSKNITNSYK